jgi:nucleotide-binding universal stress UspA family protein
MFDGFHSAIVGVDGSDESIVALDQARRLLAEGGALTAVTVCEERLAVHAGFNAPAVAEGIHVAAAAAQALAAKELASLPGAEARLAHGKPTQRLLAAAKELRADLLAVGCHEHSRAGAIVFGSVPSELLHYASETVLVARRRERRGVVSIVVGVDGSPASLAALAVAREVAAREGAHLLAVAAERGKGVDSAVLDEVDDLERHQGHPVDVLIAAAEGADLVVLGNRGLHGLAALGSVSERVAHHAPCSILVVRGAAVVRALSQRPANEAAVAAGGAH